MASLTIEGIPPGLLSRLADAALANGRSVNSEAILSLLRHVHEARPLRETPGTDAGACPFAPRPRAAARPGRSAAWGDPG